MKSRKDPIGAMAATKEEEVMTVEVEVDNGVTVEVAAEEVVDEEVLNQDQGSLLSRQHHQVPSP